jgi:hypothetical protein
VDIKNIIAQPSHKVNLAGDSTQKRASGFNTAKRAPSSEAPRQENPIPT